MGRHVFSTFVAAPPEQVFDLWINLDRMPDWVEGVSRITDVSGPVDRAGTSYAVWFGRMASRTQVLEVERPRRVRTRFRSLLMRGTNDATFEPHDGGTSVTQRFETQGIISALAARVFATGSYKGSFRGELATFARLAEADAGRG